MASTYVWLTRSIPGFSVILVFALLVSSLIISPYGKGEAGHRTGEATTSQLILSAYTVLLHVLSIVFPVRVCWAMRDVLKNMREAGSDMPSGRRPRVQSIKDEKTSEQLPVPLFAIILPAYKEEVATLEETLRVLASHMQARASYHVRLLPVLYCSDWGLGTRAAANELPGVPSDGGEGREVGIESFQPVPNLRKVLLPHELHRSSVQHPRRGPR